MAVTPATLARPCAALIDLRNTAAQGATGLFDLVQGHAAQLESAAFQDGPVAGRKAVQGGLAHPEMARDVEDKIRAKLLVKPNVQEHEPAEAEVEA